MWPCLAGLLALSWLVADSAGAPLASGLDDFPLYRRTNHARRSRDDLLAFALSQANGIRSRYGDAQVIEKRATAMTAVLSNLNADSQYFATIQVGTPSKSFYIVIDTGSADLWLAEPSCSGCPSGIQTYQPSASSSSQDLGTSFAVTYGSGQAIGQLVEDTVTMAGYSVSSQTFAAVNQTTGSLLTNPVSGLMGFGWQSIASSRATPWWTNAGISEFSFALTRFQNDASATVVEPGGIMTINGVNSTLYTGSINYVSLLSQSFWLIPLGGVYVNSKLVTNSSSATAIDTGTTLIGGPSAVVAAIYAQISGSKAQTGNYAGYYTFPCSSTFQVALEFGGIEYPIAAQDFNLGPLTSNACLGAIFAIDTSAGQPAWIVGDSWLKSYYTTFRASPAAVGFASLSSTGSSLASEELEASLTSSSAMTVSSSVAGAKKSSGLRYQAPSWAIRLVALGLVLFALA